MADFGAPIAKDFDPLAVYQKIIGIQQAKQNLQLGQAQLQQEQQNARQRQNTALFMQHFDPGAHVGDDGTLDLNEVFSDPKIRQAAGDNFPQVMQLMQGVKNAQLQGKESLASLNGTLRNQLLQGLGALREDPDIIKDNPNARIKAGQAIDAFETVGGKDAARVARVYRGIIQSTPPGKLHQALSNFQLMAESAAEQGAKQTPSYVNTGSALQNVNPQAPPGSIPLQLGPEARATTITLPNQQQAVLDRATGRYRILEPGQGGGAPAAPGAAPGAPAAPPTASTEAPGANAPGWQQGAYQGAVGEANTHVTNVRTKDQDYGNNMALAGEVRRLSTATNTGPGTQEWNRVMGTVTSRFGGNNIADYQTLGSFLDRQASNMRDQMGLPATNEGLATAKMMAGNLDYQRGAVQAKNNYVEALTQGMHDYRQALDRLPGASTGNVSPTEVQKLRSAWAANFDPRVYEIQLAQQRGDQAAARELVNQMSPQEAKQAGAKLRKLRQLMGNAQ